VKKRNRFILKEKTMTKFVYIFVKSPNSTSTFLVNQKGLGISVQSNAIMILKIKKKDMCPMFWSFKIEICDASSQA